MQNSFRDEILLMEVNENAESFTTGIEVAHHLVVILLFEKSLRHDFENYLVVDDEIHLAPTGSLTTETDCYDFLPLAGYTEFLILLFASVTPQFIMNRKRMPFIL